MNNFLINKILNLVQVETLAAKWKFVIECVCYIIALPSYTRYGDSNNQQVANKKDGILKW